MVESKQGSTNQWNTVDERADAILKMLRVALVESLRTNQREGFQITVNVAPGGTAGVFEIKQRVNFQLPG